MVNSPDSQAANTSAGVSETITLAPIRRDKGSALIVAIMVIAVLTIGFGTYMESLGNYRALGENRVLQDKSLMAAEAGLAEEEATLKTMATLPTSDITATYTLPTAQFAPFENVSLLVHVQTVNSAPYWTIVSTATADPSLMRGQTFDRRVQCTLSQENFAKFERFANTYNVYVGGAINFIGANLVYTGPLNFNSGVGFFPNFWSVSKVTAYAPAGINYYADYSSYVAGVSSDPNANSSINILNYWSSTYPTAPQFLGGLGVLTSPITVPTNISTDPRSNSLVNNAGLTLPAGYTGYIPSAGPNFVVTLVDTGNAGNGQIQVKQYLGSSGGVPSYGPTVTTTVQAVNGALVVQGNIVGLSGTLNGRLSIGALATASYPSGGNVNITGSLIYQSQAQISNFQYATQSNVINADGTVNTANVTALQNQLNSVTDMLGIVSEGDVVVKQYDLNGNPVGGPSNPLDLDAVVMATGVSTGATGGGAFYPENQGSRAVGDVNILGGSIVNVSRPWATAGGGGLVAGFQRNLLWDKRASLGGGAPPFFPSTGNLIMYANSWSSTYVTDASAPAVYPTIQ